MNTVIGERLRETFHFFRNYFGALLLTTLPFGVAATLLAHTLGNPLTVDESGTARIEWRSAVPIALLEPFALSVRVLVIHRLATGVPIAVGPLIAQSLALWPVMTPTLLLIAVSSGAAALLLFIIPGVYLYARFGLAPMAVALESRTPLDAIAESWRRTRPGQLEVFLLTLLLTGIVLAVMTALALLAGRLAADSPLAADLFARGLNETVFVLVTIAFYRLWSLAPPPPGDRPDV